jgi:hypothetical protein
VRTGRWRSISPWPTSKIVLSWSQWNGGEIIKASTTKKKKTKKISNRMLWGI